MNGVHAPSCFLLTGPGPVLLPQSQELFLFLSTSELYFLSKNVSKKGTWSVRLIHIGAEARDPVEASFGASSVKKLASRGLGGDGQQ